MDMVSAEYLEYYIHALWGHLSLQVLCALHPTFVKTVATSIQSGCGVLFESEILQANFEQVPQKICSNK